MAGVSSPMLIYRPRAAARFLFGLTVGAILGASLVAAGMLGIGQVLALVGSHAEHVGACVGIVFLLGVADISNRTPQAERQVPQRFIRALSPGPLGLVWGVDLGLMFTTQKVVSLVWAGMVIAVLLEPSLSFVLMWTVAGCYMGAVVAWTLLHGRGLENFGSVAERRQLRLIKIVSGLSLIVISAWIAI